MTKTIDITPARAVLLDCDGVVLDTEAQYSLFWGRVGREKFPERPDFADSIKGQTLVQIKAENFSRAEDLAWLDAELDRYERQMEYPYIPGALALLQMLRDAAIPVALVTSSDHAKMQKVYARHPEFPALFDRIFTSEDAARSKPAPDCYLGATRALGFEAGECIVVEDSINGLRAARAAGCRVIGLATTLPATVLAPYCDDIIQTLGELKVNS